MKKKQGKYLRCRICKKVLIKFEVPLHTIFGHLEHDDAIIYDDVSDKIRLKHEETR